MMSTNLPLDHFEEALLAELRAVVSRRSPVAPRRRPVALVASVTALLSAVAVAVAVVAYPEPAYAVTQQSDGSTVLAIYRLEDAEGLEADLATRGITAEVTYDDAASAAGWSISGQAPATADTSPPTAEQSGDRQRLAERACAFDDVAFTTGRRGSAYTVTIPADSIIRDVPLAIQTATINEGLGIAVIYAVDGIVCVRDSAVNYLDSPE